jgi:TnpA family transposase
MVIWSSTNSSRSATRRRIFRRICRLKQSLNPINDIYIDWKMIAENFDEMINMAVSTKTGKLPPSTILRRPGSYNRRNRLNQALHELGRVV